jgi:glutamyl-Q tRNA(Asp) synthetase
VLTRFAPAPTGALHLGHVLSALYVWGLGARRGARVLLRIEDHDRQRSRREHEAALLDDLDWLGFEADLYPTSAFRAGSCQSRQSDRDARYRVAATRLIERGLVYGCRCSRRDSPTKRHGDVRLSPDCPGRCGAENVPPSDGLTWRLRTSNSIETFDDAILGPQASSAQALGDAAIRDRRGNWTYQFAVTVDDFEQGIDLVIRGRDLLDSTGFQIRLAAELGRETPAAFAHHPLLMKASGRKLSKSDGDSGIRELAQQGWPPDRVLGHAASLGGLIPEFRPVAASDAPSLFT